MNKINIENFQKDYQVISDAVSAILQEQGIILGEMVFGFIETREGLKICAKGYDEKIRHMACSYLGIDQVMNYIEKDGNMSNTCTWSTDVDGVNYYTECGHTYFPYIKGFEQPKVVNDVCPWCGNNINYVENDEYDE